MKFKKVVFTIWMLLLWIAVGCVTKRIAPEEKPEMKVIVKTGEEPSKPVPPPPPTPEVAEKSDVPAELEDEVPTRGPVSDKDKYIVLNFDQADLQIVLQTIAEIVGMNYIMGPKISGKITIQTYKKIPKEDIFSVLHSILEINGFTTVKTGHYFKIIPLGSAKQYPIKTVIGKITEDIPEEDIPVTQIIPLDYIPVGEVASIIKPLVSKHGNLITHKASGLLILTEIQSNLRRLMQIINLLDTPQQEMLGERVFVYYVENGEADKIAKILTQIYKKKKKRTRDTRQTPIKKKKTGRKTPKTKEKGLDISEFEGDLKIVADTEINALIIKTTANNYEAILKVLKQIDIIPRQALIEVLIANIKLTEATKFGLQWASARGSITVGGMGGVTETFGFGGAPPVTSGFSYLLQRGEDIMAALSIEASKGNVNVLSSPYILAADNKEAVIDIVNQVPIPTTTFTGTATQSAQQSFQYKDAGIRLKVTPKINKKGLVNMKISQEVSSAGTRQSDGSVAFDKRLAQTTVVVQDGQTLVIGGLIEETISHDRTGIPFLMDIPVLGYLFGTTTTSTVRTELIILITPHVIHSHEDAALLTRQYKKKMKGLQEMKKRMKVAEEEPLEEL